MELTFIANGSRVHAGAPGEHRCIYGEQAHDAARLESLLLAWNLA